MIGWKMGRGLSLFHRSNGTLQHRLRSSPKLCLAGARHLDISFGLCRKLLGGS